MVHTGNAGLGKPSIGSWVNWGLGTENQNLPGFVVLISGGRLPRVGKSLWGSGFLPSVYQGVQCRASGDPVLYVKDPEGMLRETRRATIDAIADLGRAGLARHGDRETEARIAQYELAYRMQAAVPEICDLSGESVATKAMYGLDSPDPLTAGYARQALLARRLVEKGVRFVELSCLSGNIGGGNAANPWDHHGAIVKGHGMMAHQVDQPIAALLKDLKQRGLLDSTIVIFSGEFGRTPFSQGSDGRDHNPYGFSLWVAGGGFKPGTVFGATDELGYYAVDKPLTVYDFWATILNQLGIDHEKLTYRFGGRDFRLTDVHGNVVKEIVS